jgi:hypothetical protein
VKHRVFATALISLLPLMASGAQDLYMETGFGLASTRMDDLKYLQEYMAGMYVVEGKVLSSFPPYVTFSLGFRKELMPSVRIGASYAYTATGGKSDYTDYTGSITTMMQADSHRLGGNVSYAVFLGEHYDLSVFGELDLNYSRLDVYTTLYVLGYGDRVQDGYSSLSPAGSAGIEFFWHFGDLSAGVEAGYQVDRPGKLKDRSSQSEFKDPADSRRVLTIDWTGWQVQVKAMFRLPR